MIYITKQEGLYQNKVNSSLVSTGNCKMDYLVKARVKVPITLLHIYWVCQYKLFLISEGFEHGVCLGCEGW